MSEIMSIKEKFLHIKNKVRIPKVIRTMFVSMVVVLVFFVAAGVGYTYLTGSEGALEAVDVEEAPPTFAAPSTEPSEPAADANVSASVQAITSPVAPGENASLTVRTLKDAECTILVEYDEVASEDSGLIPKVADSYGMVSWAWTVEETVPEGEWPAEVTCSRNEKSAMVRAKLVVETPTATN